jgi:hypothetical protein
MTDALQVPLVKRAFDLLGAQFVRMDDGFAASTADPSERSDAAETEES